MQIWSDRIFQQYTARLVALARSRMQNSLQSRFDPEDVVMSAWRSFFCGMQGGHFREGDTDSLWPLLAMVFDTLAARPHDLSALCEIKLPDDLVSRVKACLDKQSQLRPSAAEIVAVLNKYADI